MEQTICGKAFVLGDDVDTDQIIPAEHLVYNLNDPVEKRLYGKYALSGVPIAQSGLPGGNTPFITGEGSESIYSIIIGGKNFGCGSSREHAPFALREAGAGVVVAESYARIFFRNSVNGGYLVPCETATRLVDEIRTGDEVEISLADSTLTDKTTGKTYRLQPLGDILPILQAGDIFAYAHTQGMM
jgi:3-isopropylmalate/(R)-2-methylmalate dehydratase small subunit